MCRAEVMLKCSLTGALTWTNTLRLFVEPTWTPEFLNARTVRYGHSTFLCHIQEAKCVWCNGSYKLEHHCQFTWCCKANAKMNPPWLETKQSELCPHSFKCSNCWRDYQADSNICLFWRYWFNYNWHSQKQQELHENRSKSICSVMSSSSLWSMTT